MRLQIVDQYLVFFEVCEVSTMPEFQGSGVVCECVPVKSFEADIACRRRTPLSVYDVQSQIRGVPAAI